MAKTKTVKIDGLEVKIRKFNPMKGGTLLGTTIAMFSTVIKDIVSALEKDLSEEKQLEVFIGAIQGLFEKNTPEEVMKYLESIVVGEYVIVDGKKVTHFDDFEALSGEDGDGLHLAIMIVAESIKFNFSKFLGKLIPALNS